jgi:hypothetical protein
VFLPGWPYTHTLFAPMASHVAGIIGVNKHPVYLVRWGFVRFFLPGLALNHDFPK